MICELAIGREFCQFRNENKLKAKKSSSRQFNPVADHFNDENHLNNKFDYKINIVGQEANKNRRLRLEEAWMLLLNTHYPNELNSKW